MQKRIWTRLGLLALVMQTPPKASSQLQRDSTIERIAEAYRRAVLAGDAAAVGATYSRDAIEMPPCRPRLEGRAAIQQYYEGLFATGKITGFTFSRLETATSGDIGFAAGAYKRTLTLKPGEAMEDSGSFVVIVKREANAWKSAYVIYNSDRPPAAAAVIGPALISPFPALMNYYAAIATRWLFWLACFALGCACLATIARVIRRSSASPAPTLPTVARPT
jgi:ketosteroid isomerase-like protein